MTLAAVILTSLVTACQRLHVDPFAYLRDVFDRISAHPAHRLAELLPDNQWQAAWTAPASACLAEHRSPLAILSAAQHMQNYRLARHSSGGEKSIWEKE